MERGNGKYAIFITDAQGTYRHRITDYQYNANHPVWSPDGRKLVISAVQPDKPGQTCIALLNLPPWLLTSSTP